MPYSSSTAVAVGAAAAAGHNTLPTHATCSETCNVHSRVPETRCCYFTTQLCPELLQLRSRWVPENLTFGNCYSQTLHRLDALAVAQPVASKLWKAITPVNLFTCAHQQHYYDTTRKLCYRKDDRAMRSIYGCRENLRDSLTTVSECRLSPQT